MMTKQKVEYLSVGELAGRIKVSESFVRRLIGAGSIEFRKVGGIIRIPFPQEALRGFAHE